MERKTIKALEIFPLEGTIKVIELVGDGGFDGLYTSITKNFRRMLHRNDFIIPTMRSFGRKGPLVNCWSCDYYSAAGPSEYSTMIQHRPNNLVVDIPGPCIMTACTDEGDLDEFSDEFINGGWKEYVASDGFHDYFVLPYDCSDDDDDDIIDF